MRQHAAQQRDGESRQRAIMPRAPAQQMHPPRRQPAGKRRIKRFDAKRQPRRPAPPLDPGDIAAQAAEACGTTAIRRGGCIISCFRGYAGMTWGIAPG